MEFNLNEDQLAFQDSARRFASVCLAPNAADWDRNAHFPIDIMREAAAIGFGGIYVAADVGGSDLKRIDAAIIFEALAEGCTSTAAFLSIHNMAAWMIDCFGSVEQRQRWLPDLTTMTKIASYCLTEPGSGSDAAALKTKAILKGDHYILNGGKAFISGAGTSDLYITMVRTGDEGPKGVTCLAIPKDTPGISFGKTERKMGWNSQPTAQVIFEDARVPVENRIGAEGEGFKIAMSCLDNGRFTVAAGALGLAKAARDASVKYANERKSFGKKIGEHQLVQQHIAKMELGIETSEMLILKSGWMKNEGLRNTKETALAKWHATNVAWDAADAAVQIHGGNGFSAEFPVERMLRNSRGARIYEGTDEIQQIMQGQYALGYRVDKPLRMKMPSYKN